MGVNLILFAFTVTQRESTLIANDTTSSVDTRERNRKHSPHVILDVKELRKTSKKEQKKESTGLIRSDRNKNKIDTGNVNRSDLKDCNLLTADIVTNSSNNYTADYFSTIDNPESNTSTIRRKPKQKIASNTAASRSYCSDSYADSNIILQSSTSFAKQQQLNEIEDSHGPYEINHPSLIEAFHQQANQKKDSKIQLQVNRTISI